MNAFQAWQPAEKLLTPSGPFIDLEIDFMAKKYDLIQKKIKKRGFILAKNWPN